LLRLPSAHADTRNGTTLEADLLLVATGVKPNMDYLAGSPVEHERGILVSDTMQTSVANVWSAGDCAQAKGFSAMPK